MREFDENGNPIVPFDEHLTWCRCGSDNVTLTSEHRRGDWLTVIVCNACGHRYMYLRGAMGGDR